MILEVPELIGISAPAQCFFLEETQEVRFKRQWCWRVEDLMASRRFKILQVSWYNFYGAIYCAAPRCNFFFFRRTSAAQLRIRHLKSQPTSSKDIDDGDTFFGAFALLFSHISLHCVLSKASCYSPGTLLTNIVCSFALVFECATGMPNNIFILWYWRRLQ